MKPFSTLLSVAAIAFAFSSSASAQVQTFETISSYRGTSQWSIDPSRAAGEVFSDLIGIQNITYNFFNNGAPSSAFALSAKFVEWNDTSTPNFSGSLTTLANRYTTLVDFGSFEVPAFVGADLNGWETYTNGFGSFNTYAQEFDFSNLPEAIDNIFTLDAAKTYALVFINENPTVTPFGIGLVAKPDEEEILPTTFVNGYAGIGNNSFGVDYSFSQISIVPVPVIPEASTVAAMIGAAFIAGLVGLRIRQRRQVAALPAAPVAA